MEGRYRDIDHEYDKAIEIYRSLFVLFPDNLDYGLKLAAVQVRGGKGQDALGDGGVVAQADAASF